MTTTLTIVEDPLDSRVVRDFLLTHLTEMRGTTSLESSHALDLDGLRAPDITVFTAWDADERGADALLGTAALKRHDAHLTELKSMRIAPEARGRGLSHRLLDRLVAEARSTGHTVMKLETGTQDYFIPARAAYTRYGFTECEPFGQYRVDPSSVYMELALRSHVRERRECAGGPVPRTGPPPA